MVERLLSMQEAAGSMPANSIFIFLYFYLIFQRKFKIKFYLFFLMVKQIEYLYEVRNKGVIVKSTLIRINKESGLYAEYEKMGQNEGGEKIKKSFNLKNEDFGILPNDKLFDEFNKLFFPKITNFFDKRMIEKNTWHITVDKVEYFGNSEPDFFQKLVALLKVKSIEKYMSKN